MHISELTKGSEVQGWTRIGLALAVGRNADGSLFRYVPLKPRVAAYNDLPRFLGLVSDNDPEMQVLSVNVSSMNSKGQLGTEPALPCLIAYPVLQRLRIFSTISHPARPSNPIWPTRASVFMPYRTVEEVELR